MSPRVMVLAVIDAGGTRMARDEYLVLRATTAPSPAPSLLLTRDTRDDAGDVKPWWAISLIGKDPRPNLIELPIFDNRGDST